MQICRRSGLELRHLKLADGLFLGYPVISVFLPSLQVSEEVDSRKGLLRYTSLVPLPRLPQDIGAPPLPTNSGGAPESLQIKVQVMAGSGEIVAMTASQIFCRTSTNPQISTSPAYLATSSSSLSKNSTLGQVRFQNNKNSTAASYKRKIHSNGQ